MYEEFMEYDENPKRPCKFFAEGKCLKVIIGNLFVTSMFSTVTLTLLFTG